MKRFFMLLLIALLCLLPASVLAENLLQNGGFELVDETGLLIGWEVNIYHAQKGDVTVGVSQEKVHSGQYSASIENASSNDTRLICTVSVEPGCLYRLSGYVLVDYMQAAGNGANFALEGLSAVSECLFDTEEKWVYLEWYGETGPSQTELTFGLRVGGYSSESVGKAFFDDIVLEKVEKLPAGTYANLWYYESTPVQKEEPAQPQKSSPLNGAAWWPEDSAFALMLLITLVLLLVFFVFWVGRTMLMKRRPVPKQKRQRRPAKNAKRYRHLLNHPQDARLNLAWKDWAIMGTATVLYAVLAFTHLGSTVAPQTAWISSSGREHVVMDLGESQEFQVLYYGGVSYYDFSISVSEDGENWSEPYPCEMREGLCYRWVYATQSVQHDGTSPSYTSIPLTLNGRYLRLNAEEAGLNLWEIVARDLDGNNLPLSIVSHSGVNYKTLVNPQPVEHLVDEADTCIGEPGWYNGTYFDEIYYARTAYEHLHGQLPYETTHPPLGKLLMAVGIAIFGMTPFGWRFAGTLIGVLMLPALYLLAKQLTHRRSIASLSMIAFALDLMHYTQTRIATIDSFPVFFILLSYLFMVRYMQTDVFAAEENPRLMSRSFLRTLVPLFLSGLCMGLSIACKWIGVYAAVGLALLFFVTIFRQWQVSRLASCEDEHTQNSRGMIARQFTAKRMMITCLFCVGFFMLIPGVIYFLCYIPCLSPSGPVTIGRVVEAQIGMFSYHSTPGLGMDHLFYSPWWEWPFIQKPMWYVQDVYGPSGYASTIMCMGNPWIFYVGAFAMAAVLVVFLCRMVRPGFASLANTDRKDRGMAVLVVSIGFLAQYLPWVLVPRGTFIYHYFASVPFIILATALCIHWIGKASRWIHYSLMGVLLLAVEALLLAKMNVPLWPMLLLDAAMAGLIWLSERRSSRFIAQHGLAVLYILVAALFFAMFFPYASGCLTSIDWLESLRWFSKLYY